MRKFAIVSVLLALILAAVPAFAQEVTPDPELQEPIVAGEGSVRLRLAHFAPGVPIVYTWINGERTDIQSLEYPAMTGWIEIPTTQLEVALTADVFGENEVVSTVNIDAQAGDWITLALTGSLEEDTVQTYQLVQHLQAVPEGCAHVTVFNSLVGQIEPVDLVMSDGEIVSSGLGAQLDTAETGIEGEPVVMGDCPTVEDPAGEEAEDISGVGPVECALVGGGTVPACATAFYVAAPATYDWRFIEHGADFDDVLNPLTLNDTVVESTGYLFLAIIGDPAVPQYFAYSLSGEVVQSLILYDDGRIVLEPSQDEIEDAVNEDAIEEAPSELEEPGQEDTGDIDAVTPTPQG